MSTVATLLLGVLLAIVVLVGISFVLSRVVLKQNAKRARAKMPPLSSTDFEEAAVGLTAPYKAYGLLRWTSSELLFGNGRTGDVLTIPRRSIVGCVASEDVPTGSGMQTLRRPALVIQVNDPTIGEGLGFVVTDADDWVARLRKR